MRPRFQQTTRCHAFSDLQIVLWVVPLSHGLRRGALFLFFIFFGGRYTDRSTITLPDLGCIERNDVICCVSKSGMHFQWVYVTSGSR